MAFDPPLGAPPAPEGPVKEEKDVVDVPGMLVDPPLLWEGTGRGGRESKSSGMSRMGSCEGRVARSWR